jgi:hypothetical protein
MHEHSGFVENRNGDHLDRSRCNFSAELSQLSA